MTLRVVLHRDDVAAGDNNAPLTVEVPDDARVAHAVLRYVRERHLPELSGCGWLVRQLGPRGTRDLALLVTLDHPREPLVLRLDDGVTGRAALADPAWRHADGTYAFEARYRTRVGPFGFDNYAAWVE